MKVSTKGRYALRIMIDLAEHNTGGYIRLKDVGFGQTGESQRDRRAPGDI